MFISNALKQSEMNDSDLEKVETKMRSHSSVKVTKLPTGKFVTTGVQHVIDEVSDDDEEYD